MEEWRRRTADEEQIWTMNTLLSTRYHWRCVFDRWSRESRRVCLSSSLSLATSLQEHSCRRPSVKCKRHTVYLTYTRNPLALEEYCSWREWVAYRNLICKSIHAVARYCPMEWFLLSLLSSRGRWEQTSLWWLSSRLSPSVEPDERRKNMAVIIVIASKCQIECTSLAGSCHLPFSAHNSRVRMRRSREKETETAAQVYLDTLSEEWQCRGSPAEHEKVRCPPVRRGRGKWQ